MAESGVAPLLLERLARLGVELWREGSRLRYQAPRGAVTPELRQEIFVVRDWLLESLPEGEPKPAAVIIEAHGETFAVVPDGYQAPGGALPITRAEVGHLARANGGDALGADTVRALAAAKRHLGAVVVEGRRARR